MRRQSLCALAYPSAAPASPAAIAVSARQSWQEGWRRCCCNNLNCPARGMLIREQSDAKRATGDTCGA